MRFREKMHIYTIMRSHMRNLVKIGLLDFAVARVRTYDIIYTSKIGNLSKFCDFLIDIDYNSKTDVFRDVSLIINQCEPRRPKDASGGHSVRYPRSASKRSPLVYFKIGALKMT